MKEIKSPFLNFCIDFILALLLFLSGFYVVTGALGSFTDISDKTVERYNERSQYLLPRLDQLEESIEPLQIRVENLERRFPAMENERPSDQH